MYSRPLGSYPVISDPFWAFSITHSLHAVPTTLAPLWIHPPTPIAALSLPLLQPLAYSCCGPLPYQVRGPPVRGPPPTPWLRSSASLQPHLPFQPTATELPCSCTSYLWPQYLAFQTALRTTPRPRPLPPLPTTSDPLCTSLRCTANGRRLARSRESAAFSSSADLSSLCESSMSTRETSCAKLWLRDLAQRDLAASLSAELNRGLHAAVPLLRLSTKVSSHLEGWRLMLLLHKTHIIVI